VSVGQHRTPADAELVLRTWLAAHPTVTDHFGQRIAQKLPPDPTWPYLTFRRRPGSGPTTWPLWLDTARIDLSSWGNPTSSEGEAQASLGGRIVLAALADLEGETLAGGVVTSVDLEDFGGLPDTTREPTIPRYVLSAAITLHPVRSAP
jgi:hypothetical protein